MIFFLILLFVVAVFCVPHVWRYPVRARVTYAALDDLREKLKKLHFPTRSRIVIGIDFTATDKKSPHTLAYGEENVYERVISALITSVEFPESEKKYGVYGFGCSETKDTRVSNLNKADGDLCDGLEGVIESYHAAARTRDPGEPGSLAPLIYKTIDIAAHDPSKHVVLFILTPGLFYDSQRTAMAVREAAFYNISIVAVSLGGHGDSMHIYYPEHHMGYRTAFSHVDFANFQMASSKFSLCALSKIPEQMEVRGSDAYADRAK